MKQYMVTKKLSPGKFERAPVMAESALEAEAIAGVILCEPSAFDERIETNHAERKAKKDAIRNSQNPIYDTVEQREDRAKIAAAKLKAKRGW